MQFFIHTITNTTPSAVESDNGWWITDFPRENDLFCGLFNDDVRSLNYITSSDRIINEESIEKFMDEIGRGLIYDIVPAFAWRIWGKTQKLQSRKIGLLDRDMKVIRPENAVLLGYWCRLVGRYQCFRTKTEYDSPKRRCLPTRHGVVTEDIFIIVKAVRTSDLTWSRIVNHWASK